MSKSAYQNAIHEYVADSVCTLVGSLDPYVHGSLALYNVCDPASAYLFDHAKGHTLPRDKETVKELANVVREAACLYGIHA